MANSREIIMNRGAREGVHLQSDWSCNKLTTVPKAGCWFDRKNVSNTGHHERHPSGDIIDQPVA